MYKILVLLLLLTTSVFLSLGIDQDQSSPYFLVISNSSVLGTFPLKNTEVIVSIAGVIAQANVTQIYQNNGDYPIEAFYVFPSSTSAAVHHMEMTITSADGKTRIIQAQIKEKQQARQIYTEAREQGKKASLLEQHRPNVFSVEVANILPLDEIRVTLSYSELLAPVGEDKYYSFHFPTVVATRYTGGMTQLDTPVPENGVEALNAHFNISVKIFYPSGMTLQSAKSKTHSIISTNAEDYVLLTLNPELEGNSNGKGRNGDFILDYEFAGAHVQSGLLLYQNQNQSQNEYPVQDENENFFLMMLQPPKHNQMVDNDASPREFIFVVDVSGSMLGFPIETAYSLMTEAVKYLRPGTDLFNILLFDTSIKAWKSQSVSTTQEAITNGLEFIQSNIGGGGTELGRALEYVFENFPTSPSHERINVVITDGEIYSENTVFSIIDKHIKNNHLFAFGIGGSPNRHLIEKLPRGKGMHFIINSPADILYELSKFMQFIVKPALQDIRVEWPSNIEVYDVLPQKMSSILLNTPINVVGKWRYKTNTSRVGSQVKISGKYSNQNRYQANIKLRSELSEEENLSQLKYLWARTKVNELDESREEMIRLALKYNLLTKYTSFVAVEGDEETSLGQDEVLEEVAPRRLCQFKKTTAGVKTFGIQLDVMNYEMDEFAPQDVRSLLLALSDEDNQQESPSHIPREEKGYEKETKAESQPTSQLTAGISIFLLLFALIIMATIVLRK
eukprot:TRINITY_DN542_c0_g1_i1.p1 TRINITY_DN542_c0_g1~~TRINITY_DN542_c0_g1_i1.p1  ORF type:complete len:733 (-),score=83.57 TRINITY_DN542_c0_g1_i1:28-2226(-)